MAYSKEKTIKDFKKASRNISMLYKASCINRKGETSDSDQKKFYSEIFSEELLKIGVDELKKNIKQINRENYLVESHSETISRNKTNRKEENFAKGMVWFEIDQLGKVIDFQIPLKHKKSDKAGKIDLITLKKGKNPNAYIIELKYHQNDETLLRAVLEIFTYYCQLNKENLIKSFEEYKNNSLKPENIKKAVLLGKGSRGSQEANDLDNRPKLNELIKNLGVEIFLFEYKVEKI